jgi:hypothetical protein
MINEQKERNVLTKMSDLEYTKNDLEMMRYRTNRLAYFLGLGGMAFGMVACFFELNSINSGTFHTMVLIILNIAMLLGGFLGCEKTKNYSKAGCISLFVFGGLSFARIFYVPVSIVIPNFKTFMKYVDAANAKTLAGDDKIAYDSAVSNLGPSVYSKYLQDADSAHRYFFANGNVRGAVMIVLLAASAALFIAGGVIGYLRSKKLTDYLSSIGTKM